MPVFRFMVCFIISSLFLHAHDTFAQRKVEQGGEFWPQYYLTYSLDSSWSLSSDYSHRYRDFDRKIQWIGRLGLGYQLNDVINLSAGYAYSEYFSETSVRRERRPWQQIQFLNRIRKVSVQNRLRLEERFNIDSKARRFNYRLRYQFQLHFQVLPQQKLSLFLSDEPMINFGKEVYGNKFDQNRFQAGFQVKLSRRLFFSPAYQHTYQIQSNKKDFKSLDILRTGFIYKR